MALRTSYELFLDDGEGPPVFEAIACADEAELLGCLRRMLEERSLRAIEVRWLGEPIFTLAS